MNISFEEKYAEAYEKLNVKQKKAVDTIDGPVMVVAGPGTGKTQILSRRVANILRQPGVKPEDILCLTYTEAGASEMLDRLEDFIGEEGRNVQVSTIHAFCSNLILSNPEKFGNQPQVISEAAKYEILKEVMDEHIVDGHILFKDKGQRYSSKDQLLDLFSKMKKEDYSKEKITAELDEYFKEIELSAEEDPFYKQFKYAKKYRDKQPGDLKPAFDKEKEKFKNLSQGAEIVEEFSKKVSDKNYYDFDDMILWTKRKLSEDRELQDKVSSDIKYLLVDEFQDTSVVQNELINLLVKGNANPNIFVVGDDDQSIYRFQGVSADNLEAFKGLYNPELIVLDENYRSSQAIIDTAKKLIVHNPNREDKELQAAGDNKAYAGIVPTITEYETEEDEIKAIVAQIKRLTEKTKDNPKPVLPSEIAVIYGRHSYGKRIASALTQNGIFSQGESENDLLKDNFSKKLLDILTYLSKKRNVGQLRKILYFDFFNISADELSSERNIRGEKKFSSKKIQEIDTKFEALRKKIQNKKQYYSPMRILQDVMNTFEIDEYVMKSQDKYHLVSVWRELYAFMVAECQLIPQLSLSGFLTRLSDLKEMIVSLPINEISASPDNCIQLMTAHGSKGREFEYVFLVKCNDGKNKSQNWPGGENTSSRFAYPPFLNGKAIIESDLKEEENRRLFYVAMTRAKKELRLSYSKVSPKSHFLEEIGQGISFQQDDLSNEVKTSLQVTVPNLSKESKDNILKNFSFSVSTLNSFLKCPLSFYFNKALGIASEGNEAMTFGSIVHSILQELYVSNENDSQELTQKAVLSKEDALKRAEEIFEKESWKLPTERSRQDDKARGIKIIENLYQVDNYIKPGIIAIERKISGIKLGDFKNSDVGLTEFVQIEINGKLDKIELEGDILRVVDYKTGNSKKAQEKLLPPSEVNPLGGDYWRQAVFYHLLLENSDISTDGKKLVTRYVFIEDAEDERGFSETQDFEISQDEVNQVLGQIVDSLQRIKDGNIACGCSILEDDRNHGVYACDYCTMAVQNEKAEEGNLKAIEMATLQQARNNFKSLSVSNLNRFLNCHQSFYFDNVLQLTETAGLTGDKDAKKVKAKTNHAPTGPVFGTFVHETMQAIYEQNLGLDKALEVFDDSLSRHVQEIIDTMGAKELKVRGHKLLENLFESYIPNSCKEVKLEKRLSATLDGKYPINGILDKIEFDDDVIRIVDYKTGSTENAANELEKGNDYWRQAAYYNILIQESSDFDTKGKSVETRYVFVDDENVDTGYSTHDVKLSEEEIAEVKTQIRNTWDSIRSVDFVLGCGREDCDFCRLGKFVDFKNIKIDSEKKD